MQPTVMLLQHNGEDITFRFALNFFPGMWKSLKKLPYKKMWTEMIKATLVSHMVIIYSLKKKSQDSQS